MPIYSGRFNRSRLARYASTLLLGERNVIKFESTLTSRKLDYEP